MVAATADEVLTTYKDSPEIDIVFADINLVPTNPDDDSGLQVARTIREDNPEVPIITYSAMYGPDDIPDGQELTQYYPKGRSDVDQLIDQLQTWRELAGKYRRAGGESPRASMAGESTGLRLGPIAGELTGLSLAAVASGALMVWRYIAEDTGGAVVMLSVLILCLLAIGVSIIAARQRF